jgi:chromosome segregation ATPase
MDIREVITKSCAGNLKHQHLQCLLRNVENFLAGTSPDSQPCKNCIALQASLTLAEATLSQSYDNELQAMNQTDEFRRIVSANQEILQQAEEMIKQDSERKVQVRCLSPTPIICDQCDLLLKENSKLTLSKTTLEGDLREYKLRLNSLQIDLSRKDIQIKHLEADNEWLRKEISKEQEESSTVIEDLQKKLETLPKLKPLPVQTPNPRIPSTIPPVIEAKYNGTPSTQKKPTVLKTRGTSRIGVSSRR